MAVVVIDLLGDEEDGIVKVVEKTTPEKPFAQKRQNVPHAQLEIVPFDQTKVEKQKNRRVRTPKLQS